MLELIGARLGTTRNQSRDVDDADVFHFHGRAEHPDEQKADNSTFTRFYSKQVFFLHTNDLYAHPCCQNINCS